MNSAAARTAALALVLAPGPKTRTTRRSQGITELRPTSTEIRTAVLRVLDRLEKAGPLARIAADGEEPEHAARYVAQALVDVERELRLVKRAARFARS